MGLYKLHVLDPGNAIMRILECEGRDDLQALEKAQSLAADATIEVWQDNKRIARIKRGDAPPLPDDPVSG